MNKKILFLVVALLFLPLISKAASLNEPLKCCKLNSDVNLGNEGSYAKNEIVGSPDATSCVVEGSTVSMDSTTTEWGFICLLGSIGAVTRWVFISLMVVSPLMIILGAYFIVTAGDEPEKVETGKNYIIWAAVGLVVALFSNAIPNLVASLLA